MKRIISISEPLTYFPGSVYGIPSSVIVGKIVITNNIPFDTSTLDMLLEENLLFDLYSESIKKRLDALSTEKNTTLKLIKKLLYWYNQIHQVANMPISKKLYISPESQKGSQNTFTIAFHSFNPNAATYILEFLLNTFNRVLLDIDQKPTNENIFKFVSSLKQFSLKGTNKKHFVNAILELNIPYRMLSDQTLLIGQGVYMKKMMSSSTDNTSVIGVKIAQIKYLSSELLSINGFPVAPQLPASSLEVALKHAKKLGYPVVLKPTDQDQGRGISSNIKTEKKLTNIYNDTVRTYKNLIIEKHIFGKDYRFSVVNEKIVNIFQRLAGNIVGDGKSTVKELVSKLQQEHFYKQKFMQKGKHLIELDKEALSLLSEWNYTPGTVLKKAEKIPLRRQNNVSTGGKLHLISPDNVHPDNLKLAIKVAELFHLDMAGIDFISEDITRSWLTSNVIICEVNAIPELGFSTKLSISKEILQDIMKDGVRIPIQLVIVDLQLIKDKEFFHEILQNNKYKNCSINNYVIVNGEIVTNRMKSSFHGAQTLLINEKVAEAYCFITLEEIQKFGLPTDWFQEIIITTSIENDTIEKINPHTDNITYHKLEDIK